MNEQTNILVSKYAQALLNTLKKTLSYDNARSCLSLAQTLKKDTQILFFLPLGIIDIATKKKVLTKLIAQHNALQELQNLFLLMIQHQRAKLIPHVLIYLFKNYLKMNNIEPMTISSSHKLTDNELQIVLKKLEQLTQKNILPTAQHIDKNLIAGIRAQSNETLWEKSIAQQIRALEHTINHKG